MSNRKIRILQFPISSSYGGITRYALNNWYRLDKDRFECDFVTMSSYLDFANEVESTGAKIHYMPCYPTQDESLFRKTFSKVLENDYDIVHLHTKQWKDFIIEQLCKEKGIKKVIVHSHNTQCDVIDDEEKKIETRIHNIVKEEFSKEMATDFWACSKNAAEWLFGPQIPPEKIKIMHNAIDVNKFWFKEEVRKQKRKLLDIPANAFVIGCVGRLSYQKNQQMLIEVFDKAFHDDETKILILIGDGQIKESLINLTKEKQINSRVRFLGMRDDVEELYQCFDIYALPSRFEGLPISMIEAQTAGLKCLVNRTITEEVEITNNCIWVEDDIDEWVETLKQNCKTYERKDMRDEIKRAGYDINEQIKIIENEYSSII